MTLRWVESFDIDWAQANMLRKYDSINFGGDLSASTPRLGFGYAAYPTSAPGYAFRTPSKGSVQTLIMGMGILPQDIGSDQLICMFCDPDNSDAEQVSLWMTNSPTSGKTRFKVKRGATIIGTASIDVNWNFWMYLEFKALADTDGTDGEIQVKINGATVISETGLDTTDSAGPDYDKVHWFLVTASGNWGADDMYVVDDLGGYNDDFLGDCSVEGKMPNGNGATTEWGRQGSSPAANYDRVQEQSIDDDSSYNNIATDDTGKIDLFTKAALSVITGDVFGVMVTHSYRLDSTGAGKIRLKFRNPTPTLAEGPDQDIYAIDHYQWFTEMYEQNPTISDVWTVADFNAMQIGYESRPA